MKNAIMMSLLFLMAGMSGCLGDNDNTIQTDPEPTVESMEYNYSDAYQYDNYAPMGMGNSTQVTMNQTNMSVIVEINMSGIFHEPLFWNQGSVNVSILDDNETVLWTDQTSDGQSNHTLVVSDNYSYNGNITLRIRSDGSDNATDGQVADWYVVRYDVWCEWRLV